MNKLLTASALVFALSVSAPVSAQNVRGGFQGPGLSVASVSDIEKVSDDTPVKLVGKIEKSLGDEKYLFRDSTGSITVEIDDDDWMGVTVTPNDTVEIEGEVDKNMFRSTEIDVDRISVKK